MGNNGCGWISNVIGTSILLIGVAVLYWLGSTVIDLAMESWLLMTAGLILVAIMVLALMVGIVKARQPVIYDVVDPQWSSDPDRAKQEQIMHAAWVLEAKRNGRLPQHLKVTVPNVPDNQLDYDVFVNKQWAEKKNDGTIIWQE